MEFTTYKERRNFYLKTKTLSYDKAHNNIKHLILTDFQKMEIVKDIFNRHYELFKIDLSSNTRRREVVEKRQQLYHYLRVFTSMKTSFRDIALFVGNTNSHCTVMSGIKNINNLLECNKTFKKEYDELHEIIKKHLINKESLLRLS